MEIFSSMIVSMYLNAIPGILIHLAGIALSLVFRSRNPAKFTLTLIAFSIFS